MQLLKLPSELLSLMNFTCGAFVHSRSEEFVNVFAQRRRLELRRMFARLGLTLNGTVNV